MKAGEYVGADGQTYEWKKSERGYLLWRNGACSIALGDVSAAKAALDALVLSEKVELEKREAQASEVLRDACLEFREAASRRGQVCGPCDECKLQSYWGKGVDALVEAESGEWVELETMDDAAVTHRFRIQLDGTNPQYWAGNRWWGEHNSMPWILAYRKGREVAQQESADLRDAARELVEAIASTPTYCREHTFWSVKGERWERIQSLAKALEGKL